MQFGINVVIELSHCKNRLGGIWNTSFILKKGDTSTSSETQVVWIMETFAVCWKIYAIKSYPANTNIHVRPWLTMCTLSEKL